MHCRLILLGRWRRRCAMRQIGAPKRRPRRRQPVIQAVLRAGEVEDELAFRRRAAPHELVHRPAVCCRARGDEPATCTYNNDVVFLSDSFSTGLSACHAISRGGLMLRARALRLYGCSKPSLFGDVPVRRRAPTGDRAHRCHSPQGRCSIPQSHSAIISAGLSEHFQDYWNEFGQAFLFGCIRATTQECYYGSIQVVQTVASRPSINDCSDFTFGVSRPGQE